MLMKSSFLLFKSFGLPLLHTYISSKPSSLISKTLTPVLQELGLVIPANCDTSSKLKCPSPR